MDCTTLRQKPAHGQHPTGEDLVLREDDDPDNGVNRMGRADEIRCTGVVLSVPIADVARPTLAPQHQRLLDSSAIAPHVAAARGYRTVTERSEIRELRFSKSCPLPGLLIPLHGVDGTVQT